jgi:hypothetical protein
MSNFKILSTFSWSQKCRQKCSRVKFATKLKDFTFLSWNLYGGTFEKANFKTLSIFLGFWTPNKLPKMPSDVF